LQNNLHCKVWHRRRGMTGESWLLIGQLTVAHLHIHMLRHHGMHRRREKHAGRRSIGHMMRKIWRSRPDNWWPGHNKNTMFMHKLMNMHVHSVNVDSQKGFILQCWTFTSSCTKQEAHPACKNWVMRCWCGYLFGARCRLFPYGPADATAIPKPHHLLPHLKKDWSYLSGTGLPRLSQKRPLNGCSNSSSNVWIIYEQFVPTNLTVVCNTT